MVFEARFKLETSAIGPLPGCWWKMNEKYIEGSIGSTMPPVSPKWNNDRPVCSGN